MLHVNDAVATIENSKPLQAASACIKFSIASQVGNCGEPTKFLGDLEAIYAFDWRVKANVWHSGANV
jgi:hypothetical protein